MQPRFSPGTDVAALEPDLTPLLASSGGRWTLAADGQALERSFRFKTFAKTWDFMTAVSLQCKIKSHHPEWSNVPPPTPSRQGQGCGRGLLYEQVSGDAAAPDAVKHVETSSRKKKEHRYYKF